MAMMAMTTSSSMSVKPRVPRSSRCFRDEARISTPTFLGGRMAGYRGRVTGFNPRSRRCGPAVSAVNWTCVNTVGMTMTIRAARGADVDQLAQIWFDGWRDGHLAIVPAALARLRTLESFRDRLRAAVADT